MSEKLTTEAAAKTLGVTPGRIRQMVLDGSLEAEKFGSNLAIDATSVEAAKQRKTKPGPAPSAKTIEASRKSAPVKSKPAKKRTTKKAKN